MNSYYGKQYSIKNGKMSNKPKQMFYVKIYKNGK